jgi:hypothetical protein
VGILITIVVVWALFHLILSIITAESEEDRIKRHESRKRESDKCDDSGEMAAAGSRINERRARIGLDQL